MVRFWVYFESIEESGNGWEMARERSRSHGWPQGIELRNCKKGAGIAHTEILGKEWVWGRKLGFGFGHAVSYAY